jgi:3-isopropylmalate/(R)-2-methylmalate dehydratase small subunit
MKKFTEITSIAIPLSMKDVDTDMIIPAQYLTQISKSGYGDHLFTRLKKADKNFTFNDKKYSESQILISLDNFGCGSSREHAVWALQQAGIKSIIASSFSDIFASNASKNGLLLITLDTETISELINLSKKESNIITINLKNQEVSCHNNNQNYHFKYDPFRKKCLLNGQDDLDFLLSHINKIDKFKTNQAAY